MFLRRDTSSWRPEQPFTVVTSPVLGMSKCAISQRHAHPTVLPSSRPPTRRSFGD